MEEEDLLRRMSASAREKRLKEKQEKLDIEEQMLEADKEKAVV